MKKIITLAFIALSSLCSAKAVISSTTFESSYIGKKYNVRYVYTGGRASIYAQLSPISGDNSGGVLIRQEYRPQFIAALSLAIEEYRKYLAGGDEIVPIPVAILTYTFTDDDAVTDEIIATFKTLELDGIKYLYFKAGSYLTALTMAEAEKFKALFSISKIAAQKELAK